MAFAYLTPYRSGSPVRGIRPSGSIFDLHRQMNRMFDDLLSGAETGGSGNGVTAWPAIDIRQDDHQIEVCAELPGVERDNISIDLDDGMLTISGEKKLHRDDETGYSERLYGQFERRVSLPANVDEETISAVFENGLLTVTLPLTEERSRGRKIELGSEGSKPRQDAEGQLIEGKTQSSRKKARQQETTDA